MNIEPTRRKGLLGFALERLDSYSGEKEWLNRVFWYCVATMTLKMGDRMRFAAKLCNKPVSSVLSIYFPAPLQKLFDVTKVSIMTSLLKGKLKW